MTTRRRTGAAVAAVLLVAAPLMAHVRLRASEPARDAVLAAAPEEIRLRFSEAVDARLARVRLLDASGAERRLGPVGQGASGVEVVARVEERLDAGSYTVDWQVTAADGHPVRGRFAFVVEVEAVEEAEPGPGVAGAALPPAQEPALPVTVDLEPPGVGAPAFVAARWLGYAALLAVIGVVAFRFLVLIPAAGLSVDLREARVALESRVALLGRGAVLFLLLAAAVRFALQVEAMGIAAADVIRLTLWGRAWVVHFASGLVVLAAMHLAQRGVATGWVVAGLAVVLLAISSAMSGHATTVEGVAPLIITAAALHVLAVSSWLGALLVLVLVAVPLLRGSRSGPDGPSATTALVRVFSPRALVLAGVTVATGSTMSLFLVGGFDNYFATAYGRTLLIKLGLVAAVVAAGAYNWRRVRPQLEGGASAAALRRSAAIELAAAAAVLLATSVLVATPPP
jgi:copper transport protein